MIVHNRLARTYLCSLMVLTFLVSGCGPSVQNIVQTTATIAPSATMPPATNIPVISPTVEVMPTPTVGTTLEIPLSDECIPIEENMPDNLTLSGVWVRNRATPYLETVEGLTAYEVPFEGGGLFSTRNGDMAISPDGKHLAYIDAYINDNGKSTDRRILRVIDSSGHSLLMDYWVESWQSIMGWVDDKTITLLTGGNGIITLNPFSGEWNEFQEPEWAHYFSDFWNLPPYNSTLEWILIRPEPWILNLVNVQTGETTWSRNTFIETTWSTDGSTLVVLSSEKIEIISNGKLTVDFDTRQLEIDDFIFGMKLSPDNKNLIVISYPNNLYLINVHDSKFSILCNNEFRINSYENPLAWSPDNRFVVLEMYDNYREQFDLLIDIQQMKAYKLTSGQYQHRLVWLAEP